MILILGGTSDAREIARSLTECGHAVELTTVNDYAAELVTGDVSVRVGALDEAGLRTLTAGADAVIDATHPFATAISALAIAVCAACDVPYLRFERPGSALPPHVHVADTAQQAAVLAVEQARGGTIFLTVGSKTLAPYVQATHAAGCRIVARILPVQASLAECERLGLPPRDIIGMQGPTTLELETALLRYVDASVLVTKESGLTGGVLEKIAAAEAVDIPCIVVRRPRLDYPLVVSSLDDVLAKLVEATHAKA
ncbi:MAG: precorrin-6A reductase [Armatimonadota bacterium]